MRKILLILLIPILLCGATFYSWRYREHAVDCTAITDGRARDLCFEIDDEYLYKCEPTVSGGVCDTAAEWKLTRANLWSRTDTTLGPKTANDNLDIGSGDFTTTGDIYVGSFRSPADSSAWVKFDASVSANLDINANGGICLHPGAVGVYNSGFTRFGDVLLSNTDLVFECDGDNNGSNKFSWTDGASAEVMSLSEAGVLTVDGTLTDGTLSITGGDIASAGTITSDSLVSSSLLIDSNIVNLTDTTDEYVLGFDTTTQTWRGVPANAGTGEGDIKADGTIPMSADWEFGNYDLTLKGITLDGTLTDGTLEISGGVITGATLEDADGDCFVYKAKIAFEDPTATDDFFFDELTHVVTFTKIYAKTLVGTVDFDVSIGGADINGTDITATTDGVLDDDLGGDTAGAIGEEVKLLITSVSSAPTYALIILTGTYDN